jgi:hypothetical protein
MRISLRSMLIAGVSTLAVSSLAVAPVRATPEQHVAQVPAQVQLSAAVTPLPRPDMASALAEISQIAADLDLPLAAADVTAANPASDFVNWVYAGIIQWTNYFAEELAPYVLQFVPFGWLITDQIFAIYPPIIQFTDSVVYQLIDPVLNDPLNLEVWANGLSAVAYTAVASLVNVAINEVNLVIDYFLGWLPPLPPIPPWPPFPVTAATTLADGAGLQAALPGVIAAPIAGVSNLAANIAHTLVNLWYPPADLIDGGVGFATNVLDGLSGLPGVGVANFQLKEFWSLIETGGDTVAGFANDLISIANDLVANSVYDGIAPAIDDALWTTVQSVQNRGNDAVGALTNFSLDQLQYFTGVYLPHTVNPDVDLPQGPPNDTRFTTPQVLRDVLGPLAGLLPSNPVTLPAGADVTAATTDSTEDEVTALDHKTEAATTDESPTPEDAPESDETPATEDSTDTDDDAGVAATKQTERQERAEARKEAREERTASETAEADDSADAGATEKTDKTEKADSNAAESAGAEKSEKSETSADD